MSPPPDESDQSSGIQPPSPGEAPKPSPPPTPSSTSPLPRVRPVPTAADIERAKLYGQQNPSDISKGVAKKPFAIGCGAVLMALAILIYGGAKLFSGAFHSGPSSIVSIGKIRLKSCTNKGQFGDTVEYSCVVRNYADEIRDSNRLTCAGFDSEDRLIGSGYIVNDLLMSSFHPDEERIARVEIPADAKSAECSETGDLFTPPQLNAIRPQLVEAAVISTVDL